MEHDRVRPDFRMAPDNNASEQLCARAYINLTPDDGSTPRLQCSYRYLLKDKTVRADARIGVDDHAIGVGQQQAALDLTIQWNVRATDNAPEAMT